MTQDLYANLLWLPKAPVDFRERCNALRRSNDAAGPAVARLANHSLDENQLRKLASVIDAMQVDGRSLRPLTPFTIGLAGNGTLDPLVPALVATAARHGIALRCIKANFGLSVQEALSPTSGLNAGRPDAVLLAFDHRALPLGVVNREEQSVETLVSQSLAFLKTLRDGFHVNGNAPCIVQTLAPVVESTFGSFDAVAQGTVRRLTAAFNAGLADSVLDTQDMLLDVASLAAIVGLANWHSPRQWNIAKFAFDSRFLPLYADHVCRLIGALLGKSRRCLVMDLDNTIWGGVIGDDGLEGIVLGQGDATGEAYLDVQRAALALRERGIVLAVSSKNDDEVARTPFRDHPEMLLRENHIAVFQANWNDKATNIAGIAGALSLGVDAMVFLDDNPVERGLVRESLPAVAVPELPEDPALYARTLSAAGYFEAVAFSNEDRKRAQFYQENARRVALQAKVGDLAAYLASLKMKISFRPFDPTGRSRIAQLINKSNQFNLTTRRYSEHDLAQIEVDPCCFTLQVRLLDLYGDNGMISVVICRLRPGRVWEIDTWLMSCRVLGRRVEHMVLREILYNARAVGIERLIGVFIPTERNGLVADHYANLGFAEIEPNDSSSTTWELATETEIEAAPMEVDRTDVGRLVAETYGNR